MTTRPTTRQSVQQKQEQSARSWGRRAFARGMVWAVVACLCVLLPGAACNHGVPNVEPSPNPAPSPSPIVKASKVAPLADGKAAVAEHPVTLEDAKILRAAADVVIRHDAERRAESARIAAELEQATRKKKALAEVAVLERQLAAKKKEAK